MGGTIYFFHCVHQTILMFEYCFNRGSGIPPCLVKWFDGEFLAFFRNLWRKSGKIVYFSDCAMSIPQKLDLPLSILSAYIYILRACAKQGSGRAAELSARICEVTPFLLSWILAAPSCICPQHRVMSREQWMRWSCRTMVVVSDLVSGRLFTPTCREPIELLSVHHISCFIRNYENQAGVMFFLYVAQKCLECSLTLDWCLLIDDVMWHELVLLEPILQIRAWNSAIMVIAVSSYLWVQCAHEQPDLVLNYILSLTSFSCHTCPSRPAATVSAHTGFTFHIIADISTQRIQIVAITKELL